MSQVKVWAHRDGTFEFPSGSAAVNLKFTNGDKEVSVVLDNSCGQMKHLERGDILCFNKEGDVTKQVFGNDFPSLSLDNLERALTWVKQ